MALVDDTLVVAGTIAVEGMVEGMFPRVDMVQPVGMV